MCILEQGHLALCGGGQVVAGGYVREHPRIDEGIFVNTSTVKEAGMEGDELHFHTISGSHYRLSLADLDGERLDGTKAALESLRVTLDVDRCKALMCEKEKKTAEWLSGVLKPCELYVRLLCDESVTHAYYMDAGGKIAKADVDYHVGTFQDSILIRVYGQCDFRFFPKGISIEPYHWSDGLRAVRIHNICEDFDFIGTSGRITCKGGEVTAIESKEYTGEGLMSPDSVTGKSMLTDFFAEFDSGSGDCD